jgi:NAD+ kinase
VRGLGVVVHPSRNIDLPLRELFGWAEGNGATVVQLPVAGQDRTVARHGDSADCDLIVSIGGDGTMLAAIRAAVAADTPVLGVSCGSLGVLTSIAADALPDALDGFSRGDWSPRWLPALSIARNGRPDQFAINDMAVVRAGIGQVRVATRVDGVLFSRLAGDGCIVSTPIGSSAYALAAGGPLLTPEIDAFLLTPLPTHGGSRQPLVISARSVLELEVSTGIGGARLEIDGQVIDPDLDTVRIVFTPTVAKLVSFPDSEPLFACLRRRQVIVDSPRIVADDSCPTPGPAVAPGDDPGATGSTRETRRTTWQRASWCWEHATSAGRSSITSRGSAGTPQRWPAATRRSNAYAPAGRWRSRPMPLTPPRWRRRWRRRGRSSGHSTRSSTR